MEFAVNYFHGGSSAIEFREVMSLEVAEFVESFF